MVSTRACGALSQGSNPCRHPKIIKKCNYILKYIFGVPTGMRKAEAVHKTNEVSACRRAWGGSSYERSELET